VNPGDTWFTLTLREYGKPHLWKKIALFNGLPLNAGLVPGMQLKLPVIHPNGVLLPSSAPAPIALGAPAPVGLPPAGGVAQANFIPQGGPQFGGLPQGAPTGPQANMIPPAGANFVAPQGATMNGPAMNAPAFNGAAAGQPGPMGPIGSPNGAPSMFQGNGPIMPNAIAPNAMPSTTAAPIANIRTVSAEVKLPSVAIGSVLSLDGQSLGNERGLVRLSVSGITLPVEVLEWSTSSAKIQLPQIELAKSVKAELEVLRADGSLASKSAIELTPAANRLALGN
jgi:hypothetical protein